MTRHVGTRCAKFIQMPALLRIVWDAYWEALERRTPTGTQVVNAIEGMIRLECVKPPTQLQIHSMIDAIGMTDDLKMYSDAACRMYDVGHLFFNMRMVPSSSLQEFYNGTLLNEWIQTR